MYLYSLTMGGTFLGISNAGAAQPTATTILTIKLLMVIKEVFCFFTAPPNNEVHGRSINPEDYADRNSVFGSLLQCGMAELVKVYSIPTGIMHL